MKTEADNTEPLFRPKASKKPTLLIRERPTDETYIRYGPGQNGFEVFVHMRAVTQLLVYTRQSEPNEAIGVLAGRTGRDRCGKYTVITGVIRARDNEVEATPGRVRLTMKHQRGPWKRLEIKEPIAEPVGWWHTHPNGPDGYSGEDQREQLTWPEQHHIGILVSGRTDPPKLVVYHGPEAIPLQQRSLKKAGITKQFFAGVRQQKRKVALQAINSLGLEHSVIIMLGWLALLIALIVGFVSLDMRIRALSAKAESPIHKAANPHVAYICEPPQGSAPLTVTCRAEELPSFVETQWEFEDGIALSGSSVRYSYQTPGNYKISLIGKRKDGNARKIFLTQILVDGDPVPPRPASPRMPQDSSKIGH